ncbi:MULTISPECIES: monovalent cation/H(+) antiporter subunit G [Haloferax]|uniref:Na+/H+ antiporter subunit G n=1 Tax=Haloferax marinum TaxID=2666143 RepID=A0A6A8G720_9EURY|nr:MULTISPECIES: monovalent cation/H(+) antiporter subunit G [Haloferax]KAB1197856.1 monovalent cation/H(+) antiporter subunit G [Haloferax sp. CBA1150]MRW96919.1 Na+/H+ antiporter subunit G [Haloferax marinum]
MTPFDVLVLALVTGSVAFSLITLVGFVRLPDVFARAHAASKTETLGALLGLGAAALAFDDGRAVLKLGVLAMFVLVTGPTAAHAIVRAAMRSGVEPWTRTGSSDEQPSPSAHAAPRGEK